MINKKRLVEKTIVLTLLIILLTSLVWVAIGLWVYPIEKTLPIIPLIAGIAFGLYVSRRGN